MAEAFITEEAANFVTTHNEAKNLICIIRNLSTMATNLKKVDPTSAYSKGILHPSVLLIP